MIAMRQKDVCDVLWRLLGAFVWPKEETPQHEDSAKLAGENDPDLKGKSRIFAAVLFRHGVFRCAKGRKACVFVAFP